MKNKKESCTKHNDPECPKCFYTTRAELPKKLVKKIPIKEVVLEVSLDEKGAVMVFRDFDGKEYSMKAYDSVQNEHINLSIQEL